MENIELNDMDLENVAGSGDKSDFLGGGGGNNNNVNVNNNNRGGRFFRNRRFVRRR